jgi:hypothetical protein
MNIIYNEVEKRRNVMIDIETLGRKPGFIILSVALVEFDIKTGTVLKSLQRNFNLVESLSQGFKIEADTLKWWSKQNKELFLEMISIPPQKVEDVLDEIIFFIKDGSPAFVWANSPSFDLSMLESYFDKYNKKTPWNYTHEMDLRTISNLNPMIRKNLKKENKDVLHDPFEDCKIQIDTLKQIFYE